MIEIKLTQDQNENYKILSTTLSYGGEYKILSGTYPISKPINLNLNNQSLSIYADGVTIECVDFFQFEPQNKISYKDFGCINLQNCVNLNIYGLCIRNTNLVLYGYINGLHLTNCHFAKIAGCYFNYHTFYGLVLRDCSNVQVKYSQVENCDFGGICIQGCSSIQINNNEIQSIGKEKNTQFGYGITCATYPKINNDITINNNIIKKCSRKCVDIHSGHNIVIDNNQIKCNNAYAAISAVDQSEVKNVNQVIISNNNIQCISDINTTQAIEIGSYNDGTLMPQNTGNVDVIKNDISMITNVGGHGILVQNPNSGKTPSVNVKENTLLIRNSSSNKISNGIFLSNNKIPISNSKITKNNIYGDFMLGGIIINGVIIDVIENNISISHSTYGIGSSKYSSIRLSSNTIEKLDKIIEYRILGEQL